MFSGGRPITAFAPTTKMGLSIILGRPSIALARALSSLIRDLMLFSLKSFSEARMKSFGLLPSFFASTRISFSSKGSFKYSTTSKSILLSFRSFTASRLLPHLGLWYSSAFDIITPYMYVMIKLWIKSLCFNTLKYFLEKRFLSRFDHHINNTVILLLICC